MLRPDALRRAVHVAHSLGGTRLGRRGHGKAVTAGPAASHSSEEGWLSEFAPYEGLLALPQVAIGRVDWGTYGWLDRARAGPTCPRGQDRSMR